LALTFPSSLWLCVFQPDGKKKAYARLTPDFDALDVANKAGYI
jgi:large subunit ribosomal protein L23Ae